MKNCDLTIHERARLLELVCDRLPGAAAYLDRDLCLQFVNETFLKWLNADVAEVVGKPVRGILGEGFFRRAEQFFQRALAGEVAVHRNSVPAPDGGVLEVEARYFPHRDEQGAVIGIVSLVTDVSGLLRMEQAMGEIETRNSRLVNNSPDIIWETALDGLDEALREVAAGTTSAPAVFDPVNPMVQIRPTYVSPAVEQVLGFTPQEALAREGEVKFTPATRQRIYRRLGELLERDLAGEKNVSVKIAQEEMRSDGSIASTEAVCYFLHDDDGRIMSLAGETRDVSEQRRAVNALMESESRFRDLADSAPAIIWLSDLEKNVCYLNQSFGDFTGEPVERDLGRNWLKRLHPEDRAAVAELFMAAYEVPAPHRVEFRMRGEAGEYRWFAESVKPRHAPDGSFLGFVGILLDITERKNAERALLASEAANRRLINTSRDVIWESAFDGLPELWDQVVHGELALDELCDRARPKFALRRVFISPSVEEMLGWTPREAMTLALEEAFTGATIDLMLNALRGALTALLEKPDETPTFRPLELEEIHKDGHIVPTEIVCRLLLDEHRRPSGVMGLTRGISERRATEQALEVSNRMLEGIRRVQTDFVSGADPRVAFDQLLSVLLEATESEYGFIGEVRQDPDGSQWLKTYAITDIAWNEATRRFYDENAPGGLEFRNLDNLFGRVVTTGEVVISNEPAVDSRRGGRMPEGHPPLNCFMGLPIRMHTRLVGMVGVANCPDGYSTELAAFLQPLLVTSGSLLDAMNAERARRKTEQALIQSEERMALAVRATRDGIWEYVAETGQIWWNETCNEIFGALPSDTERPIWWKEHLHPDDRERVVSSLHEFMEKGGDRWECEYRYRRADGEYMEVVDCAYAIRETNGRAARIMGAVTDITEYRARQREIEKYSGRLSKLNQRLERIREDERSQIARDLHDELGQLVSRLQMDLGRAEKHLAGSGIQGEGRAQLEEKLVSASEIAVKIEDEVQRVVRQLRPAILDELGLVAALQDECFRFQQYSEINCEFSAEGDVPCAKSEHAIVMFRLIQELLTNVARHAHAGRCRVHLANDGHFCHLTVSDDGVGLSVENMARPDAYGILGARERVSKIGGRIDFDSTPERGTTVTVRIPHPEMTGAEEKGKA